MTNATPKSYEDEFFRWFATWLKDKGYQFSRCGFKTGKGFGARHEIDLTTGFWKEPTYSASKPPRWLYQIEPAASGVARDPSRRCVEPRRNQCVAGRQGGCGIPPGASRPARSERLPAK